MTHFKPFVMILVTLLFLGLIIYIIDSRPKKEHLKNIITKKKAKESCEKEKKQCNTDLDNYINNYKSCSRSLFECRRSNFSSDDDDYGEYELD